mmetsp:Transcript_90775/g.293045  ORF Transcript_90775/g.293045 Transcript_90775/m.293045 type:complete len:245 (+) Transcript_90775:1320-2054(+)
MSASGPLSCAGSCTFVHLPACRGGGTVALPSAGDTGHTGCPGCTLCAGSGGNWGTALTAPESDSSISAVSNWESNSKGASSSARETSAEDEGGSHDRLRLRAAVRLPAPGGLFVEGDCWALPNERLSADGAGTSAGRRDVGAPNWIARQRRGGGLPLPGALGDVGEAAPSTNASLSSPSFGEEHSISLSARGDEDTRWRPRRRGPPPLNPRAPAVDPVSIVGCRRRAVVRVGAPAAEAPTERPL